jgi:tetratricopeptide (TPR) repeat protein
MVSSAEIMGLKRIVAKNPKSLAFAWLADLLRVASLGDKQKLDEALLVANKGLEINCNFLPGRLARGRILLEKGDLAGAKSDFEAVAEQDSFCSSGQKLLLETSDKLGQPPKTEIYEKILGILEPGAAVKAKPKIETVGVNAALDDLLSEEDNTDDKEETEVSGLLLKTFENLVEPSVKQEQPVPDLVPYSPPAHKSPPTTPDVDSLIKEQLASKVEDVPDLTGDIDSLLASASDLPPALPPVSGALSPQSTPNIIPPNIDDLVKEQLVSKVENLPDLTGDLDSLLASAPAFIASEPALPPVSSTLNSPSPPDIDALINEQLVSKVENLPDLTGDMDSLLASAPAFLASEPALPPVSGTLNSPSPPNIDDLVKEQLSSKVENLPDLTGDMDSLLASAPAFEPALEPSLSASYSLLTSSVQSSPSSPNIDDLVKEQLSSKVENLPDLTSDLDSLLASAPAFLASEPDLPLASGTLNSPSPPDIDALINEQLSSKVENLPDLTGDMDSLLASAPAFEPDQKSPNIDDLVKEQLASKVEDIPDLTGDIDSLLASMPAMDSDLEPELVPYVPPASKTDSLTQTPTLTLAELYMDQGLPQKAAEVYKELLMQDPNNADLKTRLALAETHI